MTYRRSIFNRVPLADLTSPRPTRWYEIIENRAGAAATEVHIYDEIGAWGITAREFVKEFKAIKSGTINVRINSYGGEVNDGIAIYNTIAQHAANVIVWVDGIAASAASFIAMAGDEIKIARNAEIMIHDAMCAAVGNAADMLSVAEELAKCSDKIADIYAQRTGKDATHWRDQMCANKGMGTRYTGAEAVAAGLADEVVGETEDATKARARWDASIYNRARTETPGQDGGAAPDPGVREGLNDDPPVAPPALPPVLEDTEVADEAEVTEEIPTDDLELAVNADAFRAELDSPLEINLGVDDLRVTLQAVFEADEPAPDPVAPVAVVEQPDTEIIQMGTVDLEQELELAMNVDAFRAELDPPLRLNLSADDLRVTLQTVFQADEPVPTPVAPAAKVEPINLDRLAFEQTLREVLLT